MFRNNYHPAFVMGAFCFGIGIAFLSFGGILYIDLFGYNSFQMQADKFDHEDFWTFIGLLVTGFSFLGSGLGGI